MFAILTSHNYHRHLPLIKLSSAVGDLTVVDTSDKDLTVSISGEHFLLHGVKGGVDLLNVRCFYFPESFSLHSLRLTNDELPNEQRAVALDSWLSIWEAMEAVSLRNPSSWLNAPCYARQADNKTTLLFADTNRYGFRTLASLVTNDKSKVLEKSAGCGLAVKTVSRKEYLDAESLLATQYFAHGELSQFADDISTCPLLYQPFIVSPRQLRVYVFDDEVLSYEIRSDHSQSKPDVRVASDLEYDITKTDLPFSLVKDIRHFVQKDLHLGYAALDFLVEDQGPILLDVNPNGVWNWMPADLADQIDASFISAIVNRFTHVAK